MGDRYQDRWERRRARYEARRAKWEARRARYEADQARWEARRAGRASSGLSQGDGPANKASSAIGMAALGGVLILIGVFSILASSGAAAFASAAVCLAPGAVLVMLGLILRGRAQRLLQTLTRDFDEASRTEPKATTVKNDAPEASADSLSAAPQATPQAPTRTGEGKRDPSYYRQRAVAYRRRIQSNIRNRRPGPFADVMASVVTDLQHWEERVGELADRLGIFESDTIIQRDIREVPSNIARLRGQIETEADPDLRAQMERTLAGYESQQELLTTLVRLMQRTRLQLDDTLSAMGTIYSQVQVLDAMDIDNTKTRHIAEEVDEQVKRLNDLLSAVGEAYRPPSQSDEQVEDASRTRTQHGTAER